MDSESEDEIPKTQSEKITSSPKNKLKGLVDSESEPEETAEEVSPVKNKLKGLVDSESEPELDNPEESAGEQEAQMESALSREKPKKAKVVRVGFLINRMAKLYFNTYFHIIRNQLRKRWRGCRPSKVNSSVCTARHTSMCPTISRNQGHWRSFLADEPSTLHWPRLWLEEVQCPAGSQGSRWDCGWPGRNWRLMRKLPEAL